MDKSLKRKILIGVILASIAIVFVPIYFFVLADSGDDKHYTATEKKIVAMEDGTEGFDADDAAGNDSSKFNKRVRTFDSISYTVSYKLIKNDPTASNNVDGRVLTVDVLIPTSYAGTLKYADEVTLVVAPGSAHVKEVEKDGTNYYLATFTVPVGELDSTSSFIFSFEDIKTDNIASHNEIKPLVFIKESTEDANVVPSVEQGAPLTDAIKCDIPEVRDPDNNEVVLRPALNDYNYGVTLSGKEDYFVNLYVGTREDDTSTNTSVYPIGILVGLRDQGNQKGIKGLLVPNQVSFMISNSDTSKLSFVEDSLNNYEGTSHEINMPVITNGTVSGNINQSVLNVSITDINNIAYDKTSSGMYYFASEYFLTRLARAERDYSDISVSLISDKYNSDNQQASATIMDSYAHVLGNYTSNIDVYERDPGSGTSTTPLEYGKANINYGGHFTFDVNFAYTGTSHGQGDGLTSLTNYVKIDNDAFELCESYNNYPYKFEKKELTTNGSLALDVDQNNHPKVYFGYGEWNSTYFESTGACSIDIDNLTKEQLMNLYGGPCIVEKSNVQWTYSPNSSDDINGQQIALDKGPIIVKSTYVTGADNTDGYIVQGSGGTLELYGTVVDNYSVATAENPIYQIVTSASAYGKTNTDMKYLGNETTSGETFLKNPNNFTKTAYDFDNRYVTSLNSNLCSGAECAVSGTSIIVSGIRSVKPTINAYKPSNLITPVVPADFYYYPIALKIDSSSFTSDSKINVNDVLVDVYLPSYMSILNNYGSNNKAYDSYEDTTLANIYAKYNKGTPATDANYKVYHYTLSEEELNSFYVYADIDPVNTPTSVTSELFTEVDFLATKTFDNTEITPIDFRPISSNVERMNSMSVTIHNASTVITKGATNPKYIERNGSYTFNMFAYNHSETLVENGYTYPTADLYYVLPYNGNISDENATSKIGSTKFKVNFTEDSINSIANREDYKFYYAVTGVPENIITDEITTTADPSTIWKLWEDPTEPVSNVLAIKIVKQTPFAPGDYFAANEGLTVNVETVGSNDGNIFYNTFSLLTSKPSNYECDSTVDPEDTDSEPDSCEESRNTKDNYSPSPSVTSIYSREIAGFVFEDSDYNGIYTSDESRIQDIAVSLYKIDTLPENYDENDPSTYVKDTDSVISSTMTGVNGNYYFGGLAPGYYYVRFTFDNEKYNLAEVGKISEYVPDSINNNSKALLLPSTNKAVTKIIAFTNDYTDGNNIVTGMNMGLAVRKEMAVKLNKFITEVTVNKDGKVTKYDYSDKNLSQVTVAVLNTNNTKIQVKYAFSIENTKYFPGYVGLIIDSIPKDMTFNPELEDNKNWALYDNVLYYNGLSGKLLLPNEKQYFKLTLDLDLKEAGTYRNVITAKDLTIMGNDLPVYDFGNNTNQALNTLGGE